MVNPFRKACPKIAKSKEVEVKSVTLYSLKVDKI